MIPVLSAAAFNLMEYWIFILLLQYVCAADMNLCRRNCSIGTALSAFLFAAAAAIFGPEAAYPVMFFAVLLTLLLFSSNRLSALLRLIPAFALYFTLTVIPMAMLELLFEALEKTVIAVGGFSQTILSIVFDAVFLALLITLRCGVKKYHITVYFRTREILGSLALLCFTFIDGQLLALMNMQKHKPFMHYTYAAIFGAAYVFSVAYYIYTVAETWRRIYRQTKIRTEMEYLKLQLAALQDIKENEDQIRSMRHDLNKHLAVMKALCDEGKYDEVSRYTGQLCREIIGHGSIATGNKIGDMVAGQKKKLCEEQGIEFSFEGLLNGMENMEAPDICGLLANAYDNAIEACLTQNNAYVRTKVNTTRNYTVIEIANPVKKKMRVHKNKIPTSKRDKSAHGYGIEIMKQIVRKYGGSCIFRCDDKEFTVKIVLKRAAGASI